MFKFNFASEQPDEADEEVPEVRTVGSDHDDLGTSKKLDISDKQYRELVEAVKDSKANCFMSGEVEIGYLDNSAMTDSDSDLIPKVYEGGFKIWECTQDLADYFTGTDDGQNEFRDKRVCDLGCSAGILGILALVNGASRVDFQDYVSSTSIHRFFNLMTAAFVLERRRFGEIHDRKLRAELRRTRNPERLRQMCLLLR